MGKTARFSPFGTPASNWTSSTRTRPPQKLRDRGLKVIRIPPFTITYMALKFGETDTADDKDDSGGPNVAGIAGGSVVGVVVLLGAVGAMFFYMRRKRNAEIEEEHRRNAAVNSFIGGGHSTGGSVTDARLEPIMAQRRMSDGSIKDNEDYSRRILRVCCSAAVASRSSTLQVLTKFPGHQRVMRCVSQTPHPRHEGFHRELRD